VRRVCVCMGAHMCVNIRDVHVNRQASWLALWLLSRLLYLLVSFIRSL